MTPVRKRRVLYLALGLFSVWPLVQISLALQFGLHPWKLAGWGMYAVPRPGAARLEVWVRRAGGAVFEPLSADGAAWQAEARRFAERHLWLGRLTRPRALVAAVQREAPGAEAVRVVIVAPGLEARSGMVVAMRSVYEHPAGGWQP